MNSHAMSEQKAQASVAQWEEATGRIVSGLSTTENVICTGFVPTLTSAKREVSWVDIVTRSFRVSPGLLDRVHESTQELYGAMEGLLFATDSRPPLVSRVLVSSGTIATYALTPEGVSIARVIAVRLINEQRLGLKMNGTMDAALEHALAVRSTRADPGT